MKRVQFPHDVFCTQTWPPSHCFVHKYGRRNVMWKRSIGKCAPSCAHTRFCFFTSGEKTLGISSVLILKIKSFKYHEKTSCRPVRSVIILVNKQIELALRGRPILLIIRVITDQIGFHAAISTQRVARRDGCVRRLFYVYWYLTFYLVSVVAGTDQNVL